MPLVDLKTNLKDLKFGHDAPHGGSSKQPYVTTPIPATDEPVPTGLLNSETGGPDFLIRGGLLLPDSVVHDEIRLGKFFLGTNGILFTIKQNILSRINVKTQGTGGPLSKFLNQGLYTPISTLLAAGTSALGIFPNKQGLNPFDSTFYADAIAKEITLSNNSSARINNRLIGLYDVKVLNFDGFPNNGELAKYHKLNYITNSETDLIAYGGGPNSVLGIGKTHIRFATDNTNSPLRTGFNNNLRIRDPYAFYGYINQLSPEYLTIAGEIKSIPYDNFEKNLLRFIGASREYGTGFFEFQGVGLNTKLTSTGKLVDNSLANVISLNTFDSVELNNNNTYVYSEDDIRNVPITNNDNYQKYGASYLNGPSILTGTNVGDFRKKLLLFRSPNYNTQNIELRTKLGDPGNAQNKKIQSYTKGHDGTGAASPNSYDKINASVIYNSTDVNSKDLNDLIQFRIGVINNDDPTTKTYIHFRAFLDSISDQYVSNWDPTKYIGRGENFYTYSGFERKVSLSWTVAAQSKIELIPMYKRLNYLASVCAPDYSTAGYMRGNIVTLTVGGYFYEQPGIITGFNFEMNEADDAWEIGIDNSMGETDPSVKELPHIIRVKSFGFIPIHEFVPRKQIVNLNPTDGSATAYGPERYIALNDKSKESNYGPIYRNQDSSATTSDQPSDQNTNTVGSPGGFTTQNNTTIADNSAQSSNSNPYYSLPETSPYPGLTRPADNSQGISNPNRVGLPDGSPAPKDFGPQGFSSLPLPSQFNNSSNSNPKNVTVNSLGPVENVNGLGTIDISGQTSNLPMMTIE